jgi:hypothetical protein
MLTIITPSLLNPNAIYNGVYTVVFARRMISNSIRVVSTLSLLYVTALVHVRFEYDNVQPAVCVCVCVCCVSPFGFRIHVFVVPHPVSMFSSCADVILIYS